MSRYDELCSALGDHNEASRNYWQAMQLRAAQIAAGLWKYLGYPSEKYPDLHGNGFVPYVLLTKPGEEQECRFLELPGEDGVVRFDLVITIEEKQNQFPKTKLRYPLSIGSTGDVVKVWDDSKTINEEIEIGDLSFDNLYASIFSSIQLYLEYRPTIE